MSWPQLLGLSKGEYAGTLRSRLELFWWKASSGLTANEAKTLVQSEPSSAPPKAKNSQLRKHVAEAFHADSNVPSLEEKEAIFQYLRNLPDLDSQLRPSLQSIRAMRILPEVAAVKSRLCEAIAQEDVSRRSTKETSCPWSDIPLSYAPASQRRGKPENKGIHEEIYQGRRQMKAAGAQLGDLGPAGELFNLRNIGLLLE